MIRGRTQQSTPQSNEPPVPFPDPEEEAPPAPKQQPPKRRGTYELKPIDELKAEGGDNPEWTSSTSTPPAEKKIPLLEQAKLRRMTLAGVILLALIGWLVYLKSQNTIDYEPLASTTPASGEKEYNEKIAKESNTLFRLAQEFLETETHVGRLSYVRHPETTAPRMKEHYGWRPQDLEIRAQSRSADVFIIEKNGKNFLGLALNLNNFSRRGMIFEKTYNGWKIDWESFIGYSEIPWPPLLAGQVDGAPAVRATFEPDDYYNFDYTDNTAHTCYRIRDTKETTWGWAYCDRSSPVMEKMEQALKTTGGKKGEAVLRLRPAGKPGNKQFWIEEFVAATHLIP